VDHVHSPRFGFYNHLLFLADISTPNIIGERTRRTALVRHPIPSERVEWMVHEGQLIEGFDEPTQLSAFLSVGYQVLPDGEALLTARVLPVSMAGADVWRESVVRTRDGVLEKVLGWGDPVPDGDGAEVFRSFSPPLLNRRGEAVVLAGTSHPTSGSKQSIWHWNIHYSDSPRRLLSTGDVVEITPTDTREIAFIHMGFHSRTLNSPSELAFSWADPEEAYSPPAQLVVTVRFTDHSHAVLRLDLHPLPIERFLSTHSGEEPSLRLVWPDGGIPRRLVQATELRGLWTEVTTEPILVDGHWVLDLPLEASSGFFNLQELTEMLPTDPESPDI
jgi:hypothetical protein